MRHRFYLCISILFLLNGFLALTADRALADYAFVQSIGGVGKGSGPFLNPSGIAVDSAGNVYVADSFYSSIDVFSSAGSLIRQINGGSANALTNPWGVAVDSTGNIWVADTGNRQIKEFSQTGTFIQKFGVPQLANPAALAFDSSQNVWVADTNQIVEYTNAGSFVKTISWFGGITGIAFDPAGNIWVANPHVGPVGLQELTTSGTQLPALAPILSLSDKDVLPYGLTFDSHGNLWVADSRGNRVIEFDANGNTLQKFGLGGTIGLFTHPVGVAVDPMGNVWVAEDSGNRIGEFSPVPEPATALTAAIAAGALAVIYRGPKKTRKPVQ